MLSSWPQKLPASEYKLSCLENAPNIPVFRGVGDNLLSGIANFCSTLSFALIEFPCSFKLGLLNELNDNSFRGVVLLVFSI